MSGGLRRWLRDPLPWATALLLALVFGMNQLHGLFAYWFPDLQRPVYQQDSFISLLLAHLTLVGVSSLIAVLIGVSAGWRSPGRPGRSFVRWWRRWWRSARPSRRWRCWRWRCR
ncbi:Putative osmoprotectant uptake system permease protein yehW [Serratia rubidaea]|uniref:Osmoprotectant uptake system permease protein yehW n=1 Tax=Serratia rubidaea TaxID=61652 RepID=A0A3S4I3I6_SERRU|nr:Putative osmoprotectant uptake system permease protein yehW [Serratia rubidaea]